MNPLFNLDVADPDSVADVLMRAAQSYRESAIELDLVAGRVAAWQDKTAGAPWRKIATILDRAAMSCERVSGNDYTNIPND